jgi:hypothetical protein
VNRNVPQRIFPSHSGQEYPVEGSALIAGTTAFGYKVLKKGVASPVFAPHRNALLESFWTGTLYAVSV